MSKGGRPSKLTDELHADLVKWIQAGNYIETAAILCGINKASVYNWLKRGRTARSGKYKLFFDAVRQAQAKSEARLVNIVEMAAKRDWKAAAWRLERKFPNRYGRQTKHEVSGKGGAPVQSAVIYLPDNGRLPKETGK